MTVRRFVPLLLLCLVASCWWMADAPPPAAVPRPVPPVPPVAACRAPAQGPAPAPCPTGDLLPAEVLPEAAGPCTVSLVRRTGGRGEPIRIEERPGRRREMAGDHLLVTPRPGVDRARLAAAVARSGAHLLRQVGRTRHWLAAFPVAGHDDLPRQRRLLAALPEVAAVEEDALVSIGCLADDPRFGEQWSLLNTGQSGGIVGADIRAEGAWAITTGDARVLVGVIDTGVDFAHPDLAPNRWTNPGECGLDDLGRDKRINGVDDDGNGFVDDWRGWDFVADDNDPADENGHGTHCAGVIGARGGDGVGIAGIAWKTSLVGLRFLDASGSGLTSDAIAAIDYAARIGCHLTSNSWGGGASSAAMREAIAAGGAPFVAAAGNTSGDNDLSPRYPAAYDCGNIIAVASTTRTDALSTFSCFGATSVDLGAPGSDILSCMPGGQWQLMSGTSMATPHVAGVLALMRAVAPERTAAQLKAALLAGTDPLPALAGRCLSGGRLNAQRAVAAVAGVVVEAGALVQTEVGDGDGVFEPGEAVDFVLTLRSTGTVPAQGVTGSLALSDAADAIEAGSVDWGDIPVGASRTGPTPFRIRLGPATAARTVGGTITITEAGGRSWPVPVSLIVAPGALLLVQVRDAAGLAVPGAAVTWSGPVSGTGATGGQAAPLPNLTRMLPIGTYQVSASCPGYASAGPVTAAVPFVPPWPVLVLTRPRMDVSPTAIAMEAPAGGASSASLRVANPGDGPLTLTALVPDQPVWSPAGMWHRSARRTSDGGLAWWCGREADGGYGGSTSSSVLTSAPWSLTYPFATVATWRGVEADPARDRLRVEATGDGGATWRLITTITGPATAAWQQHSLPLFSFSPGQSVRLRFTAEVLDGGPRSGEGWFIDAFRPSPFPVAPSEAWLEVQPAAAVIPARGSLDLTVLAGLELGFTTRSGIVRLAGTAPDRPTFDVPVTIGRAPVPSLAVAGQVVAELAGDGDLALEPGETGSLQASLANRGELAASDLAATLSSTSAWVTVTGGSATCPDIPVGAVQTTGRFTFAVAPACPVGTVLPFDLAVRDGGGRTWNLSATAAVTRRSRLAGLVQDADGGAPLDGVSVIVRGPATSYLYTGADGRFAATGLPEGAYAVSLQKPGYAPASRSVDLSADADLEVAMARCRLVPDRSSIRLRAAPGGSASAAITASVVGPIPVSWSASSGWGPLTVEPASGVTPPAATAALVVWLRPGATVPRQRLTAWVSLDNLSTPPIPVTERIEAVIEIGTPPQALPATASTSEDRPVAIPLPAVNADGLPLTWRLVGTPVGGSAAIAGDVCTYTPSADWNGVEHLAFTVSDGAFTSDPAALVIEVAAVDDPLALSDLSFTALPGIESGLLLPAADVDSPVTWRIIAPPSAGTATLAGTRLSYLAPPYRGGSDRLELEASSASGSATCAVAVTIREPPRSASLEVAVRCNDPRLVTLPGEAGAGGPLASAILQPPRHGTLVRVRGIDLGWVYQPERDFTGADGFVFAITEFGAPSLPATAGITVAAAPAVPGKLLAPDGAPGDRFGAAVALDGDLAAVGAPLAAPAGRVYLFQRQGDGTWAHACTLAPPPGDPVQRFGTAVALRGGVLAAAGGLPGGEASVRIWTGSGASWSPAATLATGPAGSGAVRDRCVALAFDGDLLAAGTPFAGYGAVTLWQGAGSLWSQCTRIPAPADRIDFGAAVSLSDGRLLAGAPFGFSGYQGGCATVWSGPGWTLEASLPGEYGDMLGQAVALRGDTALVASPGRDSSAGGLVVWRRSGGGWSVVQRWSNPGWADAPAWDQAGLGLAWDGQHVLAGAPYLWQADVGATGAVAHLALPAGGALGPARWWRADDAAYGDWAGTALAVQGGRRLIGVPLDDGNGVDSGAVYLFDRNEPPAIATAAVSIPEDAITAIPIAVEDPDGDAVEVRVLVQPAHGTATASGAAVVFRPAADWNGVDALVLEAWDGGQAGAPATVAVTVTPVNDPPVLVGGAWSVDEDGVLAATAAAGDADGDVLALVVVRPPEHGRVDLLGTAFTYRPDPDWSGGDGFALAVSDGWAQSPAADFTVTVRPVDDPPMLAATAAATDEDVPVLVPMMVVDVDGPGTPSLALADGPVHGTCRIDGLGVIYIPAPDWSGDDLFTVVAMEGGLTSAPATVAVTVRAVDDPPQARAGSWTGDEDAPLAFAPSLADVDGGPAAELVLTAAPAHGSARIEGPTVVYVPTPGWHGDDALAVAAGAGGRWSASATQSITVRSLDDPPMLAATAAATTDEDVEVVIPVAVADEDGPEPAVLLLAEAPGHGTCRIDGLAVVYRPHADWSGEDAFNVVAETGGLRSAPCTVAVTVVPVDDPARPLPCAVSGWEDALIPVLLELSDPDGGPTPVIEVVRAPAHGSAVVECGIVYYSGAANWSGSDDFLVAARTGGHLSSPATVSVMVQPVDDAPLVVLAPVATDEDVPVRVRPVVVDVDGGPAALAVVQQPAHGRARIEDGWLIHEPDPDWSGSDLLVLCADPYGRNPLAVPLLVAPVNDRPTVAGVAAATSGSREVSIPLTACDADGDALTAALVQPPEHGSATVSGLVVAYRPHPGWSGTDSFQVVVDDGVGASLPATIRVRVDPRDDPPLIEDMVLVTDEDQPLTVRLPGADGEGGAVEIRDILGLSWGDIAHHGAVLTFTPPRDRSGEQRVQVEVADARGNRATATITLRVLPINDAPEIVPLALRTRAGRPLAFMAPMRDVDSEALTVEVLRQPLHGRLEGGAAFLYTYHPDPGWSGRDSLVFAVSDGLARSAPTEVPILVEPNDGGLQVADAAATVREDCRVELVLAVSDPAGTGYTTRILSGPAHGSAAIDGVRLSYSARIGWTGEDAFLVEAAGPDGVRVQATVRITVQPGSGLPSLVAADLAVDEDMAARQLLSVVDGWGSATTALVAVVRQPVHGTAALDGLWLSYIPGRDWSGEDSLVLVPVTGSGTGAEVVVRVTVRPVNDPPGAQVMPPDAPVQAGATVRIPLLVGDVDDSAALLVVNAASGQGWQVPPILAVEGQGGWRELVATIPSAAEGVAQVVITVSDPHGSTGRADIVLRLVPAAAPDGAGSAAPAVALPAGGGAAAGGGGGGGGCGLGGLGAALAALALSLRVRAGARRRGCSPSGR